MINKISIPNRDSTKTGFYGKEFKLEWQRNGQYAQVGKIYIDYTSCGGDEFEETEDCNECACADYKQIYHQVCKLTDTGEDSKLVHRQKRSKVNTAPPRYFVFFSDAFERRV